ncbi:glutamine amidotransferase [Candidatus Saccharibacteria bacterium]|nr:glutamine amidotransferase [Candidatus Saccharibacteria bacterium]
MSKGTIHILCLYPNEMNIYGDWGNVLTVARRLMWHGYTPKITQLHPGKNVPKNVNIVIGGGGQDSGQMLVEADLQRHAKTLQALADDNVPMLVVCGLYQLFGRFFKTATDEKLRGIGIFNAETHASNKRMIGNIVVNTQFGEIVGYENHSGMTMLDSGQASFGGVSKGAGNNGTDKTEGAVYNNVYGTYMHGSLLPKNPNFADELIKKAVEHAGLEFDPNVIDDLFADKARAIAKRRPR